jgi:hypothetical protein
MNKATANLEDKGGRDVITIATNVPVSGKFTRAMLQLFPGAEIEYKPINQKTGEVE